jgi:hypothetical protein
MWKFQRAEVQFYANCSKCSREQWNYLTEKRPAQPGCLSPSNSGLVRCRIQIHESVLDALLVNTPVLQYTPEVLLASEFGDISRK